MTMEPPDYEDEPPAAPTPPVPAITVTLDLERLWAGRDSNLLELLLDSAAHELLTEAVRATGGLVYQGRGEDRSWLTDFRDRVTAIRKDLIWEKLEPIIDAELARPIPKTNQYGETVGGTQTLAELIADELQKWLTKEERRDAYSSKPAGTKITQLIADIVDYKLTNEFQKEMEAGKEKVRAALRANAAEVLVHTIEKMAAERR